MDALTRRLWFLALGCVLLRLTVFSVDFAIRTDSVYVLIPEYWLRAKWMPLYGLLTQLGGFVTDVETMARAIVAVSAACLIVPLGRLTRSLWGEVPLGLMTVVVLVHPWIFRWANVPVNDMLFLLCLCWSLADFAEGRRGFMIWGWLAILTRPEGLVLLPLMAFWDLTGGRGRRMACLGAVVFGMWAFLRPEWLPWILGPDKGLSRSALLLESFEGLRNEGLVILRYALGTLLGAALLSWPVLALWRRRPRNSSLALVLVGIIVVVILGTSMTPQWNGRRLLVPSVLALPLIFGAVTRRPSWGVLWIVGLGSLTALGWQGGRDEYGAARRCAERLRASGWEGPVFTDDLRRVEWWLGRPCTIWRGEPPSDDRRLLLTSRHHPVLPPMSEHHEVCRFRLIFLDGAWWQDDATGRQEPVSNRLPDPAVLGRWHSFEAALY